MIFAKLSVLSFSSCLLGQYEQFWTAEYVKLFPLFEKQKTKSDLLSHEQFNDKLSVSSEDNFILGS